VGLRLNGTYQLLVYADVVYQLEDNINTIEKNKEILINTGKKDGLKINTEKTNLSCCLVSRM
jgi:hypothetical protein